MSSYYLCDTCKVYHHECVCCGQFRCKHSPRKLVMTDECEHPHEVCKHWKPKEAE